PSAPYWRRHLTAFAGLPILNLRFWIRAWQADGTTARLGVPAFWKEPGPLPRMSETDCNRALVRGTARPDHSVHDSPRKSSRVSRKPDPTASTRLPANSPKHSVSAPLSVTGLNHEWLPKRTRSRP